MKIDKTNSHQDPFVAHEDTPINLEGLKFTPKALKPKEERWFFRTKQALGFLFRGVAMIAVGVGGYLLTKLVFGEIDIGSKPISSLTLNEIFRAVMSAIWIISSIVTSFHLLTNLPEKDKNNPYPYNIWGNFAVALILAGILFYILMNDLMLDLIWLIAGLLLARICYRKIAGKVTPKVSK